MQHTYPQVFLPGRRPNPSFRSRWLACLLVSLLLALPQIGWGQTDPAAFDLSAGSFTFTGFAAGTTTTYPASMQGQKFSAEPDGTELGVTNGDRVLVNSSSSVGSGSIRNEVSAGISLLNSGSNYIGAIVVGLNTTGRTSVKATWSAAVVTGAIGRVNGLQLQYRVGTTGNFTTVASTQFESNTSGDSQTFTNVALPSAVEGKSNVQLRWIYYTVGTSGSRTRIALDDITISSTGGGGGGPSVNVSTAGPLTFNTLAGSASTAQTYNVSGTTLGATNITITPPAGFEVSKTSAVAGFAGSATAITVSPTGGTVASTPIWVRLTSAATGTPSGNVTNVSGTASASVAVSGTVVAKPTTSATATAGAPGGTTVTLTLAAGNGSRRLVVVRPAAAAAVAPTDGTTYTASLTYGSGTTTGANNFVVSADANATTSVAVTGLTATTNYVADVYTYNEGTAAGFENYRTASPGTASFTTTSAPVTCVTGGDFDAGTFPTGWTRSSVAAITFNASNAANGSASGGAMAAASTSWITTNVASNPSQVSFYLGVTSNPNARVMAVQVATAAQTGPFTTVRTFAHNTTGDTVLADGSYNQYTVDLSAYNASSTVWIRFERTTGSSTAAFRLDEIEVVCGPLGPNTTTGTITGSPFCVPVAGTAISVPFTVTNGPFLAGNIFTAQLSNASGSFASGTTTLGTVAGTTSGSISGTIPNTVASGTAYRVRVNGSNPASTGVKNTVDLEIRKAPTSFTANITGTLAQSFSTVGGGSALSANVPPASFTPTGAYDGVTVQWKYGTTAGTYPTNITGETGFSYTPNGSDFPGTGTYYVAFVATATCGGVAVTSSNEAVFTITAPAPVLVVKQGATTYTSGGTAYSFGSVAQGVTSTAVTFTIQNTGTANLTITTPLGQTGDFAVTQQPVSPVSGPSGSTTFKVTFTPTAQGARTGTVVILSNDPTTPTFTLNLSGTGTPNATSDVVFNGAFSYNSTGIDYAAVTNQVAAITNTSQGTGIYGLTVRDGGGGNDADALPTILTGLTFSGVQGTAAIRNAALFRGNALVSNTPTINVGANTIAFSSLSESVADNGSANFSLRVSFQNTAALITDNTQLRVSVASAGVTAAASSSSTFGAFTTITSSTAPADNRINVIATKLVFSPVPPVTAGVNSGFTVGVVAQDGNNVADINGPQPDVTLTISGGAGTLSSTTGLTQTLVAGTFTWNDVQYDALESGLTLSTTNTGGLTNPTASISFVAFVGKLWTGNAGDGLWSSATNWSPTGVPTAADNVWLSHSSVAAAYTVTLNAQGSAAKTLRIGDDGATITLLLSGTPTADLLTVGSASGFDLSITNGGVLNNTAQPSVGVARALAFATPASDTWRMTGDGTYQHRQGMASAPNITLGNTSFATTSNFEVYAMMSNTFGASSGNSIISRFRNFGNLLLSPPSGSTARLSNALNNGDKVLVRGNMTMVNTGLFVISRGNSSATTGITLRVIGDLSINSASSLYAGEDNTVAGTGDSVVVNGNVSGSGQFGGATGTGTPSGVVQLGGNLTGVFYNGTQANDQLVFLGGAAAVSDYNPNPASILRRVRILKEVRLLRNIVVSGGTNFLTVEAGGTLDFNGFNSTGSAPFNLLAGGTLKITDPDGITAAAATPTGNVRGTGARSFPNGSSLPLLPTIYWYTGTTAQVTGTGFPVTNGVKVLIADNPTTLTPSASLSIQAAGRLEIRRGTFWESPTVEVTGAGNLTMTGGVYRLVKGVAMGVPTALPQLSGTYALTGGAVALAGSQNQSLKGGIAYNKLRFGGSGTKTLTSTVTNLPDSLTIKGAAILDLTQSSTGVVGTVGLSGLGGLQMQNTARLRTTRTTTDGPAPGMEGFYNLTGGTIEFANSNATTQSIRGNDPIIDPTRTYYNVEVTGNNVMTSNADFAIATGATMRVKTAGLFQMSTVRKITGAGSFILDNGSTLYYGHVDGIALAGATGAVQVTGTRTFPVTASYGFRGGSNMVSGSGLPANVANLTVAKSNATNEVLLTNPVTVLGTLTLTQGLLRLEDSDVTVVGTLAGGSAASYIRTSSLPTASGELIRLVPNTATDVTFPVGTSSYTPALLRQTVAVMANNFAVRVFDGVLKEGLTGSSVATHVVNRTWMVNKVDSNPTNTTLTVQWNAADETGTFNRPLARIAHYLGATYDFPPAAGGVSGNNPYTVSRTDITSFSPFAVVDGNNVLPVELISFTATAQAAGNQLRWATASEKNNDFFEVQRSATADFATVQVLGRVAGHGTTAQAHEYGFLDAAAPAGSVRYYRLRQVDTDGKAQISSVVLVRRTLAPATELVVYPNPATDQLTVLLPAGATTLTVFDALGRAVLTVPVATGGEGAEWLATPASQRLSLTSLPAGVYRLQASGAQLSAKTRSFVKGN